MKKITLFSLSIALFLSIIVYSAVQAKTTSLTGTTGGVSYTAYKNVTYYAGGTYGSVQSTAASTMGRIGITYWTFDQKCQNGQWAFYYNIGAAINTNSTNYNNANFVSTAGECYAKFGVIPEYTRSTGNHEFNMGTPVYRFLEAKLP